MCDERDQELQDLREFLKCLDFEQIDEEQIRIVPNYFYITDLPATVQLYLEKYFAYLDTID